MLVRDILDRVRTLYNDHDYARVTQNQYLQFLDDSINQLILSRPDASVKTVTVTLPQGARQRLPEDAYSLIDIYINASGSPVWQVERHNLDYFSSWQAAAESPVIDEFAYDLRSPLTFWVSPPSDGTAQIEMDYSAKVVEFAKLPNTFDEVLEMEIPVSAIFKTPLIHFMLYLLYSTDSSSANDRAVASQYEQSFYMALGLEYKSSQAISPTTAETAVGVPVNA